MLVLWHLNFKEFSQKYDTANNLKAFLTPLDRLTCYFVAAVIAVVVIVSVLKFFSSVRYFVRKSVSVSETSINTFLQSCSEIKERCVDTRCLRRRLLR